MFFLLGKTYACQANIYKCQGEFDKANEAHRNCLDAWQKTKQSEQKIPVAYYNIIHVEVERADALVSAEQNQAWLG